MLQRNPSTTGAVGLQLEVKKRMFSEDGKFQNYIYAYLTTYCLQHIALRPFKTVEWGNLGGSQDIYISR